MTDRVRYAQRVQDERKVEVGAAFGLEQLRKLEAAWLCYPALVQPDAGFQRSDIQEHLDKAGIDRRTIWTGNVTRQPMMAGVAHRQPPDGLPNADEVMNAGLLLPCTHGTTTDELDHVTSSIDAFVGHHGEC